MSDRRPFSPDALILEDPQAEVQRITTHIRDTVLRFKRRGVVVALSGGIDSSVTGALCVRALGKAKVFGLSMPERDSSDATSDLSQTIIDFLDIDSETIDITPILQAVQCYRRRDAAIQTVIPEYTAEWKSKIVLPNVTDSHAYRLFSVVAQAPDGTIHRERLTQKAYLGILSATNFKQRVRKMEEYYHADRLNYMVGGTPNRLEYDQGFFVKLGDGAADLKPIAHLYKTQVYQLAEFLGIPEEIRRRPPTTDTYSLPQTQEEFYFSVPYEKMDLCLYGFNHDTPPHEVAEALGWTAHQVEHVYDDIQSKREATRYLHESPALVESVEWLEA